MRKTHLRCVLDEDLKVSITLCGLAETPKRPMTDNMPEVTCSRCKEEMALIVEKSPAPEPVPEKTPEPVAAEEAPKKTRKKKEKAEPVADTPVEKPKKPRKKKEAAETEAKP